MEKEIKSTIIALCNWIQRTIAEPGADELKALPAIADSVANLYSVYREPVLEQPSILGEETVDIRRMVETAGRNKCEVTKEQLASEILKYGAPQSVYIDHGEAK
ncbi:hypothetical protein [Paenibacillus sanguinis]|uniref:hypothetical protein n=1 Tax=Paenibacillus sanguinis TaxID=225906 RepID=UPI000367E80D|nr:hypothetical protein [Paenibacillus sanguinis]